MWRFLNINRLGRKNNLALITSRKRSIHTSFNNSKIALISLCTVSVVGGGAIIAYGKYDLDFRAYIEKNIPYSDEVFKFLPDFKKEDFVRKKDRNISDTNVPQEKLKNTPQIASSNLKKSQPATNASIDNEKNKGNIDEEKHNVKLDEQTLKSILINLAENIKEVRIAEKTTIEAIKNCSLKLYEVLVDSQNESTNIAWNDVKIAYDMKANQLQHIEEKINSLKEIGKKANMEIVKIKKSNELDDLLFSVRESILKGQECIQAVEKNISLSKDGIQNIAGYEHLLQDAKEQLMKKTSLLEHFDSKCLDEPTLNVIAILHKNIDDLQKETAKQLISMDDRVKDAVQVEKDKNKQKLKCQIEASKIFHEKILKEGFEKELDDLNKKFEADVIRQLSLQFSFHMDYLQEALQGQFKTLNDQFATLLEENLLQQKNSFISEVTESLVGINRIETYIKNYVDIQKKSNELNDLWYMCQSIQDKLETWTLQERVPIKNELKFLQLMAKDDNEFVITLLKGVPSQVINKGIYNDKYLKQRFKQVKLRCKQVAMVDESNRSLYRYFLSYLQSFLIIDTPDVAKNEIKDNATVDPTTWDTFNIINRIEFCLKSDDLEQALRYANQLKGEPRNIARDWMLDVRQFLELVQTINCLMTYSSAVNLQAFR